MADDSTSLSPDLPDELVHEIVLRLPPDEPACLARLSLLSRPWRLVLSDPSFHRRYRQFHRKPPMLGFFHELNGKGMIASRFVPTTRPCPQPIPDHRLAGLRVFDCRHGRVLLHDGGLLMRLVVWDPMTGLRWVLSVSDHIESWIYVGTAVLCTLQGCDHATSCHNGPFRVVFVGVGANERAAALVYFSETCEWGKPTSELQLVEECYLDMWHSVLVGDGLHFLLTNKGSRILKYHVDRHHLSLIDMPAALAGHERGPILMAAEDGGLGIAHHHNFMLYLWSLQSAGLDGVATWAQHRVIDLKSFLPIGNPAIKVELVGSLEGADKIFATTARGVYVIDLKLLQSKKLCEREEFDQLYPFTSFYIPPQECDMLFEGEEC